MIKIRESFNDTFYRRNPALVDAHTVTFNVLRFFVDINGSIIDKNTVPQNLQTKYPVFLLGAFDKNGGYRMSQTACPPMPSSNFLFTFTVGVNQPFLAFTGLNNIKGQLRSGDTVLVYVDDVEFPSYFIYIVIRGESCSLASIVDNTESTQADGRIGSLFVREINFNVEDDNQWNETIHFLSFDNIGQYRDNPVQPNIFRGTMITPGINVISLDIPFKIDQYIGMAFYMLFEVDKMSFNFKINKI